ncbi:hypothetical protein E2I00_003568 [Balaenoptera physalus]|uniref:Uncharacterized protein n=1 Tax=Balaenoptera physalus TaxID=9770 RepID=A0A6A1Q0L9_BALPH|nr:hypothetical protein E2I00_003568 [Balaenoptera physalus]
MTSARTLVPRFSDSPEQKAWQTQVTEFKALWQAAEVERDRLTEFVTVLQKRLAIQLEENEMLKAALGSALQGKEEDFRMYHETLGQVKGVFLQALRQQKADKR